MDAFKIANQFVKDDEFVAYKKFGNGHINSTYLFTMASGKQYIMQRINNNVFKDVDVLMSNIKTVTDFLKKNGTETIMMLTAKNGKDYVVEKGSYYRMYKFLDYTMTFESVENLEMVENTAKAFGWFHDKLSKLDGSKLKETIPFFHDTKKRYQDFLDALEKDPLKRSKECKKEIEIVKSYEKYYGLIVDSIKSGEVKLHVTHNDPKINNALFDINTHKFRSIIDLDTVMPGSVLYDFGDAIRSLMTGDKEDALDYKNVKCDFDIYEHYLKAYFKETKSFLTAKEIELFPYSVFIITMELAMRFLGDYLLGDVYFGVSRPNHNLDRARTQINLGKSLMDNMDKLIEITKKVVKQL